MRLLDIFMGTVSYVAYFRKVGEKHDPSFDQVRGRILRLLEEADKNAKECSSEDYDHARFAVTAWVDESMMNCAWKGCQAWQRDPLQMRFYQTMNAGELFFERLNTLGMYQNEVREVYYLCLSLGFLGRYSKNEDRILLDQLKNSHLKVLAGNGAALGNLNQAGLFPQAYPQGDTPAAKSKFSPKLHRLNIALAVLPAAVLAVLFLIYTFVLHNLSQGLLNIAVR